MSSGYKSISGPNQFLRCVAISCSEVTFPNWLIIPNILQQKQVNTVAVGIGPGVKKDILQQIAGAGNPVVQVEDFSQLQKMIETIKASACSGMFTW